MSRRRAFVLLALTALWGCDSDGLAPGTETFLSLQIGTAAGFSSSADAGVVHIEGPTNRTINIQPGETRTIEGLAPGTYTVALEALLQGRVESYDETSVTVVAGQNRQANLNLVPFVPDFVTVPNEVSPGVPFTVQFGAVADAQSYVVEADDDPGFSSPTTVQTTATTAQVTVDEPGPYFVRVRARSRFGTDGVPSDAQEITAAAGEPRVVVGAAPSSTIEVGDQLALPVQLDLSQAGGQELARIEVLLGFDGQLFGIDSWNLIGADFDFVDFEMFVEGTARVVRAVFQRSGDFGSSATLGVLTVDAATVGSGPVAVEVVTAEDPGGAPIAAGTFVEVAHQVTVQAADPVVQTLQPGNEVTNLSGGVLYFRVPAPSSALAAGRAEIEPMMIPVGDGTAQTRLGRTITSARSSLQAPSPWTPRGASPARIRLRKRALGDRPQDAVSADAAQSTEQTLRIQIGGGTGNADLYARFGQLPTVNTYDCRPFLVGNSEGCDEVGPSEDLFVMIRPFGAHNAYAGLALQTFLFDPVSISTTDVPSGVVGVPYQVRLGAREGDGSYEWTVASGSPPTGVTLAPDGTLSGTPTATGDHTFTVRVTSAAQSAEAQLTLRVAGTATPFAHFTLRDSDDPDDFEVTNLAGGGLVVEKLGIGSHRIHFRGLGTNTLGSSFTAYVTTLAGTSNPNLTVADATCTLSSLNAGEPFTAVVRCSDPVTDEPMEERFRLMVVADNVLGGTGAPGQSAGFSVHTAGATQSYTPNPVFSWNSGGATQTVSYEGGGVVRHQLGISIPAPFSLLASTLGEHGCTIANGSSNFIDVLCRNRDGSTTDQRNHLTMQIQGGRPGEPFGYALVQNSAVNADFSRNDVGTIDILTQGTGRWRVTFNGLTLDDFPAINVTPVATEWVYCSQFFSGNAPVSIDVACFDASGSFVDSGFFVTVLQ